MAIFDIKETNAVLLEQTSHVLRQGLAGGIAAFGVSTLYTFVMWKFADSTSLIVWYVTLNLIGATRIYIALRWDQLSRTTLREKSPLLALFAGLASGLMWGLAATVLFPVGHPEVYFIVAFLLIGMPAGALSSMGAWHPSYWCYLLGAVVPFIIWTLRSSDAYFVMTGIAAIIFAAFMMREGWATSQAFRKLLVQRDKLEAMTASLTQARDDAESANRAKSSFLANISHEIRTPLNAVIGLGDILSESVKQPQNIEYVRILREAARSLLGIINDVIDLSRIEAGRLDIRIDEFDLHKMLADVRAMFYPMASSSGLNLQVNIDDDKLPRRVVADEVRVRQVLVNLVSNAIKFTTNGGVTINTSLKRDSDSASAILRIEVIDTGIGIDENAHTVLFERFSQIDSSSTRHHGGAGLGLRISSELAKSMGGDIGFASKPNVGSTFWFTVAVDLPKQPDGRSTLKLELPTQPSTRHRVLVVEDNEVNLMIAVRYLESLNCDVVTACSGIEALEKLHAADSSTASGDQLHLVFMDCQMAGMDGLEATRRWRQHEKTTGCHLPIIALTANAFESDRQQCMEAGMDEHIAKPFRREHLQTALATFASH